MSEKLSCDGFPSDSTTSSQLGVDFICASSRRKKPVEAEEESPCVPEVSCSNLPSSTSSTSSSFSPSIYNSECHLVSPAPVVPNIGYELAVAKSVLQQYSTTTGDNLFDHLSEIIKRVIDERPPNVIDFFEEFSRSVREQKFRLPERFPAKAIYEEGRFYRSAKKYLDALKLPYSQEPNDDLDEMGAIEGPESTDLHLDISGNARFLITFNDRIQKLQFYWSQCGFSVSTEDTFQLACSINRLNAHPSVMQCRFWGMITGLKASYYIVEVALTTAEINSRIENIAEEVNDKRVTTLQASKARKGLEPALPPHVGPELTPGAIGWENWPVEELNKMIPEVAPIPLVDTVEVFSVPPEIIGQGVNRYTYFVVTSLSDEWIELPIVTPRQIQVSRLIKKFFTGDLESEVNSYPCFPGKEKHLLRATIARITAGTYIAPYGYFRKITKREKRLYFGPDDDGEEEEDEEDEDEMDEEEEEGEIDNDVILLKNEKYEPHPLPILSSPGEWVHVRPNILQQGRVVWFDEEKARKERERQLREYLRLRRLEEMEEEEEEEDLDEDDEGEGEEEGMLDEIDRREYGPAIFTPCNLDTSDQSTIPWVTRPTSRFTDAKERLMVIRSNVWPGAFTFTFENVTESIYMGWGHKYTSRNIPFVHLPQIVNEHKHDPDDFIEQTDPTPEEEEAYRLAMLRREMQPDLDEQLSYLDEEDVESDSENDV